jgi:hypothetical protein
MRGIAPDDLEMVPGWNRARIGHSQAWAAARPSWVPSAILWLHLDGGRITEAHHCVTCQPHDHVVDVACADCGDGPLITGQPPTSATTPPTWR